MVSLNLNPNIDIQEMFRRVKKEGIHKYMVAHALGFSDMSLSRYLRKEMSDEMKKKVSDAVIFLKKTKKRGV